MWAPFDTRNKIQSTPATIILYGIYSDVARDAGCVSVRL